MNELELFETLKGAYETTTHNNNRFKKAIDNIKWDNIFEEDGETYFMLGKFTLTVENINPFEEMWKPTVYFSDNSMIEF